MMRLFTFVAVLTLSMPVSAQEKQFTPDQVGWLQRVMAHEAVGKLKAMRDAGNWCIYEETKKEPDPRACEFAEKLRRDSTVRDDADMIKTGIKMLKEAEQTPLIREHLRVLETAMGEIVYNLRPTDAE